MIDGNKLALIAADWLDDMQAEGVTLSEFIGSMSSVRRACKTFFPTPGQVVEVILNTRDARVKQIVREREDSQFLIPADSNYNEEECKRNSECIRLMARCVSGEFSEDELKKRMRSVNPNINFSDLEQ